MLLATIRMWMHDLKRRGTDKAVRDWQLLDSLPIAASRYWITRSHPCPFQVPLAGEQSAPGPWPCGPAGAGAILPTRLP
jgi:hypothetical protein